MTSFPAYRGFFPISFAELWGFSPLCSFSPYFSFCVAPSPVSIASPGCWDNSGGDPEQGERVLHPLQTSHRCGFHFFPPNWCYLHVFTLFCPVRALNSQIPSKPTFWNLFPRFFFFKAVPRCRMIGME